MLRRKTMKWMNMTFKDFITRLFLYGTLISFVTTIIVVAVLINPDTTATKAFTGSILTFMLFEAILLIAFFPFIFIAFIQSKKLTRTIEMEERRWGQNLSWIHTIVKIIMPTIAATLYVLGFMFLVFTNKDSNIHILNLVFISAAYLVFVFAFLLSVLFIKLSRKQTNEGLTVSTNGA
jgi:hypothetical protein